MQNTSTATAPLTTAEALVNICRTHLDNVIASATDAYEIEEASRYLDNAEKAVERETRIAATKRSDRLRWER